jgi:tripartite-type tricarboxylate transporter receptor subunit TctC
LECGAARRAVENLLELHRTFPRSSTLELRALAVTTAIRSEALPSVPSVPNLYRVTNRALGMVGAPKNTPAEIVDKLNKEINASPADPAPRRAYSIVAMR